MKTPFSILKNYLLIGFALVLILSLQSCLKKAAFGNGKSWIPKELDAKNSVLVITKFGRTEKENQQAAIFMKEKYPFSYEIIKIEDTATLTDKVKYRFMLLPLTQKMRVYSSAAGGNSMNPATVYAQDFYFYDRLKNIEYPALNKGSYKAIITFKPIIATIVKQANN